MHLGRFHRNHHHDLAVLSILVGNFLAVRQVNLKRILGYSFNCAFWLFVDWFNPSMTYASLGNVTVYVITYVLTTIGAFGAVALMSSPYNNADEVQSLADYRGLFWRRPVLTATLIVDDVVSCWYSIDCGLYW